MIHIYYQFQEGPWGGGNQFLKSLRKALRARGAYSETLEGAKAVLINSHHFGSESDLKSLLSFLALNRDIRVIHRLDGPVTLIRNKDEGSDNIIFRFNERFADSTIVQSRWCLSRCRDLGWVEGNPQTIIFNAPDPEIFHPNKEVGRKPHQKIKIVATSWSPSPGKGFDVYQWMDKHLDWRKYEMTFVGNSPVTFNNIKSIPPQPSQELANILRQHDIFVTASRNDPCSNSLIEALHCGLPALVYNDGGHPEIVGAGGLVFDTPDDIPLKLDALSADLAGYASRISMQNMDEVTDSYMQFMLGATSALHDLSAEKISGFAQLYQKYKAQQRLSLFSRLKNKMQRILGKG